MVVKGGLAAVQHDRSLDVFDRFGVLAARVVDQAEQMPGVGLSRVVRQNLAIHSRGGIEVSRLMVLDRQA